MSESVALRLATIGDLEALLPLLQAYRIFYEQPPDAVRERAYVEAHLRDGSSTIDLAFAGDRCCAFLQMFKTYSTVHLQPAWILEDLFVDPAYRGRGIAAALLDRAVARARAGGAAGMFLETARSNSAAQRVYERAGWRREAHFLKYNAPLA